MSTPKSMYVRTCVYVCMYRNQGPIKNQFGFLHVEMSSQDVGS